MKRKQIVPGSVAPTTVLVHARVHNHDILAYGSENRVVLLSSHLVVLHVLEVGTEPVLALDWHDRTSRLAVSCGNHVIVYRAVPRGLGVHDHVEYLNLEKQLDTEQPFVPRALSWDPTPLGRFLAVGGSGLLIWDTLAAPIEKEPVPPTLAGQPQAPQVMTMQLAATQQDPEMGMRSGREINLVSFSPDGTLLATLGKDDRAVKVWYYNSVIGYTFVYLPHPRAVTELEWRQPHVCRPTVPNVLLTRTVDGAVLLWEETPASQRFQFTLKLTLTSDTNIASARWLFSPAQYLTDILDGSKSTEDLNSSMPSKAKDAPIQAETVIPLAQHRHDPHLNSIADRHTSYALTTNPAEAHDWVIGVQKDGSILLWKVKGMGLPKQAPIATLYSYLKHVLAPTTRGDERFTHLIALAQRFSFKNKIYHPSTVSLFTSSSLRRDLSAWSIDISSSRVSTSLMRRTCGHNSDVVGMEAHPTLPLVASFDTSNKLIIWKTTDTSLSDTSFVLNDVATLQLDSAPLCQWDSVESIIYVYTRTTGVAVYHITLPDSGDTSSATPATVPGSSGMGSGSLGSSVGLGGSMTLLSSATASSVGGLQLVQPPPTLLGALVDSAECSAELKHLVLLPSVVFRDDTNDTDTSVLPPNETLVLGIHADGTSISVWHLFRARSSSPPGSSNSSPASSSSSVGNASASQPSAIPSSMHHSLLTSSSSSPGTAQLLRRSALTDPVTSRLLVKQQSILSSKERITCFSLPRAIQLEGELLNNGFPHVSIITGGADGYVRGWGLSLHVDNSYTLQPLFGFQAESSAAIITVKCASTGRLATAARGSSEIKVWECESHAPHFVLESTIRPKVPSVPATKSASKSAAAFRPVLISRGGSAAGTTTNTPLGSEKASVVSSTRGSPIHSLSSSMILPSSTSSVDVAFDWLNLVSGGQLLAVCAEGGPVQLWTQDRSKDLFTFRPEWIPMDLAAGTDEANAEPENWRGCKAVRWTSQGQLLLARQDQLIVFTNWVDSDYLTLTRLAEDANTPLPFYHPKVLVEHFMAGDLERVHATLKHLYNHLHGNSQRRKEQRKERRLKRKKPEHSVDPDDTSSAEYNSDDDDPEIDEDPFDPKDELSDASPSAKKEDAKVPPMPFEIVASLSNVIENEDLIASINDIAATSPAASRAASPPRSPKLAPTLAPAQPPSKASLFDDDPYANLGSLDDFDYDAIGASDSEEETEPTSTSDAEYTATLPSQATEEAEKKEQTYVQRFEWNFELLTAKEAKYLNDRLAEAPLSGLTPHEQMSLMALLDTAVGLEKTWADAAAIRVTLLARYFNWLRKTNRLPPDVAAGQAPNHPLTSMLWAWALHCEDQPQLLNSLLPSNDQKNALWENVRQYGVAVWCTDGTTIRTLAERLAQQHYLVNRDPNDAAMWFILLGKKSALQTLYKSSRDDKLATFLLNDFSLPRWKEAALKNAYLLIGKQRYLLAVAFFLLGGSLKDAIAVCISNLSDYHLALFLARVAEGDASETTKELWKSHFLDRAIEQGDTALASIAAWNLHDYETALTCLSPPPSLSTLFGEDCTSSATALTSAVAAKREFHPGVLHLFRFLYGHPRVKLLRLAQATISEKKRLLESMTTYAYLHSGLTRLAIQSEDFAKRVRSLLTPRTSNDSVAMELWTAGNLEKDLALRAVVQYLCKELETCRGRDSLDLTQLQRDSGILADAFGTTSSLLINNLAQYCEARLYLKQNYLLARMNDQKVAARLLLRTAQRIAAVSMYLITNPLSARHAQATHFLTWELHRCLQLQEQQQQPNATATTSGVFSHRVRSVIEASIRVGLFVAAWSYRDFTALYNVLTSLGAFGPASVRHSGITSGAPTPTAYTVPTNTSQDLEQLRTLSPTSFVEDGDGSDSDDDRSSQSRDTAVFLDRLFGLLILVKFVNLLEEFLARNGIPNAGGLNMIRTLRLWQSHLENSLKDIPASIIRARMTQIIHGKSKYVFSLDFFDPFVKADGCPSYRAPICKILWHHFTQDDYLTSQYLAHADFLKQVMRFVRLHEDLREDFDEDEQRRVGTRLSVEQDVRPTPTPEPAVDRETWTSEEESLLEQLVNAYTTLSGRINWKPIIAEFPSQTEASLKSKWQRMQDKDEGHQTSGLPRILVDQASPGGNDDLKSSLSMRKHPSSNTLSDMNSNDADQPHKKPNSLGALPDEPRSASWSPSAIRSSRLGSSTLTSLVGSNTTGGSVAGSFTNGQLKGSRSGSMVSGHSRNSSAGSSRQFARPKRDGPVMSIRFSESITVFKDKDILQSFCINPTQSKQIAVATTHGISEIISTVDSSELMLRRSASEGDLAAMGSSGSHSNSSRPGDSLSLPVTSSGGLNSSQSSMRYNQSSSNLMKDAFLGFDDDKHDVANWLEAHPTFPYYLSGSIDGTIKLWQFNVPQSLSTFREKNPVRLTKLRFNWNGSKFAATEVSGGVQLYRFDPNEEPTKPFNSLTCHNKRASDIAFLNSGSVIAVAGESTGNKNLSVWDTLVSPSRAEVWSTICQPDGATSLVYCPRWQLLLCGGKQGTISVIDVRQRKLITDLAAHPRNVKDLSVDPSQNFLISGSNEGNVKIWDLASLTVLDTWEAVHSRQTFVRSGGVLGPAISTHGVMQVHLSRNHVYSCGSDGRLLQWRYEGDDAPEEDDDY